MDNYGKVAGFGGNRKRNTENTQTKGCHGNSYGYVGQELKLFGTFAGTPHHDPSCAAELHRHKVLLSLLITRGPSCDYAQVIYFDKVSTCYFYLSFISLQLTTRLVYIFRNDGQWGVDHEWVNNKWSKVRHAGQ